MPVTSVSYFTAPGQPAFTDVATVGPLVWIDPFEDVTARVLFRQAYQTATTAFSPTSLNTTYPGGTISSTTYILVREGDFEDVPGGQMKWNRYYACTPPQRIEYTSSGRTFPGVLSVTFSRDAFDFPTATKVVRDYYLVSTTSDIPTLSQEARITITGSLNSPLLSGEQVLPYTNPTSATYLQYITDDKNTPSSFSIRAEAQSLERWIGNFYARTDVTVKAK